MELKEGEKIELTLEETEALARLLAKRDNVKGILDGLNHLGRWVTDLFHEIEDGFFEPLAKRVGAEKDKWVFDVDDKKLEVHLAKRPESVSDAAKEGVLAKIRAALGDEVEMIDGTGLTEEQVEAVVVELDKRNDA